MPEDVESCIRKVDKLLRRVLVTASFSERSRLLGEAMSWHEQALALAEEHYPRARRTAEIIPFRARPPEDA